MSEFIPINDIPEMTEDEKSFLQGCGIKTGYYDPDDKNLVVKTSGGWGGPSIYRGRGTDNSEWEKI